MVPGPEHYKLTQVVIALNLGVDEHDPIRDAYIHVLFWMSAFKKRDSMWYNAVRREKFLLRRSFSNER